MRRTVSISGQQQLYCGAPSSTAALEGGDGDLCWGVTLSCTPQVPSIACHPAPGCVSSRLSPGHLEPCAGGAGLGHDIDVLLQ